MSYLTEKGAKENPAGEPIGFYPRSYVRRVAYMLSAEFASQFF